MHRPIHPLILLLLAGLVSGCASMSKKDCENADWHAIGYSDGARGIQAEHLHTYGQRCAEYKITPDADAYQAGWGQGIRSYCTSANGYQAGAAGLAYNNVCPADVAPAFLAGWNQGVRQYCLPANGLRQGLAGRPYRGVCPADMAGAFQDRYRLGLDLRRARIAHHQLEFRLSRVQRELAGEQDPHRRHDLLEDLARLRHEEGHSDAMVSALSACGSDDWYDAGLNDGEDGRPYRAPEIAGICRDYGGRRDTRGYRQGWNQGRAHYCTYDSGLYAGQNNLEYRGICSGPDYLMFWSGYLKGLGAFRAGRYEERPRPRARHAGRPRPQKGMSEQRSHRPEPRRQARPATPVRSSREATRAMERHGHRTPAETRTASGKGSQSRPAPEAKRKKGHDGETGQTEDNGQKPPTPATRPHRRLRAPID